MKKIIKYLFSIVLTIAISYGVIFAWNDLIASEGDTLNHTKWNELVDKVASINNTSWKTWIWVIEPDRPLHVVSNDNTNVVKIQSTNPNGRSSIDYIDDAGSFWMSMGVANSAQSIAWQAYIHAHWTHPLVLWHSWEAMRISPWKNIGMWTTDTTAWKLNITSNWIWTSYPGISLNIPVWWDDSNPWSWMDFKTTTDPGSVGNTTGWRFVARSTDAPSATKGDFTLWEYNGSWVSRVVIADGSWNMWVWQTYPKAKLDIDGWVKIAGSTCDTDHIGTMQYNSGSDTFQGCRNNWGTPAWINLH